MNSVAINARAAVRGEIGGVERVTRELAARLPRLRPERYRVLRPPALLAHRAGHAWEQALLPVAARGAELILSPANLAPAASRRNVVVIHDAAALRHPEWYGRGYAAWQRLLLPLLARRARLVLTPSEFARGEVVELLGAPPERVAVVPNGVDERFLPHVDASAARRALGLDGPYVLAVGTDIARKNLEVLGAAARTLRSAGVELAAAGSGRGYMRGEPAPPLRRLGYVPDELLPGLYAGALALALPSRYEGFGLPCLEAMASGVPVVAARAGALPETCGDAAILVEPDDETAWAGALAAAALDEATRGPLVGAGLERARAYPWDRTAERADRLLGELISGP